MSESGAAKGDALRDDKQDYGLRVQSQRSSSAREGRGKTHARKARSIGMQNEKRTRALLPPKRPPDRACCPPERRSAHDSRM